MASSTITKPNIIGPGLSETHGYISVNGEMLRRLRELTIDLFIQYEKHGPVQLYHRAGTPLKAQQVGAARGIQQLLIRSDDLERLGTQVLESVETEKDGGPARPAERYAALQLAVAMEIERSLQSIDCQRYIAVVEQVGDQLISWLANSELLPGDLFRLARHDFHTFTHVTNVAGYMVILAQSLSISDRSVLKQIAVGAMLHDIGKRFIPVDILSKPGRLLPHERALIETHPTRGYEELCHRPELGFEQLMMVYQHHERINGTGYPVGSCGDEIHFWSRMLAVVDVFDAMTGVRPYRRPATMRDAMCYLRDRAGTHFDDEVVRCWNNALTPA